MFAEQFKIRCSAINSIMGASTTGSVTKKQAEIIKDYQSRESLTDKQSEELSRLIAKRDAPAELPQGAKTYCREWLLSKIYNRKKSFTAPATEKGNRQEGDAIKLLAEYVENPFLSKNEIYMENDYITGTCDVDGIDTIYDTKCSKDVFTFPLLSSKVDKGYWSQLQGYGDLYGKSKLCLAYCLVNSPMDVIERQAWYKTKSKYGPDFTEDQYNEVFDEELRNNTFDDLDISLKVKLYHFDFDPEFIKAVYNRVDLCRKYIAELEKEFNVVELATLSNQNQY